MFVPREERIDHGGGGSRRSPPMVSPTPGGRAAQDAWPQCSAEEYFVSVAIKLRLEAGAGISPLRIALGSTALP
jgi:hypothetical protein